MNEVRALPVTGTASPVAVATKGLGNSTRKAAYLGVLLAIAVTLYVFESLLPALPVPGAKIGLANLASLLAVLIWGWREALLLVVARQVLGSLATGTFLSAPFLFGLAGGIASVGAMSVTSRVARGRLSPTGVSIAGAATHNVAQLLVARLLTGGWAILAYLPYLLWFSLPTGALIGVIAAYLLPVLVADPGALPAETAPSPGNVSPPKVSRLTVRLLGLAERSQALFSRRNRLSLRVGDGAIASVLAFAALLILLWHGSLAAPPANPEAVVRVAGELRMIVPLRTNRFLTLNTPRGRMILEVEPGRIRVRESDCPDKVCVRTGWITNASQSIVCVPNRTVITVRGSNAAPYDAVAR